MRNSSRQLLDRIADPRATTRTANHAGARAVSRRTLLDSRQLVASPETRLQYRVTRLIGEGGFGQVYLATRVGRSAAVPGEVCIKVSTHMDGWLREAYFGLLLHDHPRVIRIFDRFPVTTAAGEVLYCLVLERAPHGDLACSDHLKEIIHRCIGERRKRYESADEMIEALRHRPAVLKPGVLRSLKGVHLAFTGFLSKPRSEAIRAARRAGAIIHGGPSAQTTVVVRGRPNKLQAAGDEGGLKLMELKRLREKGHHIVL